MNLFVIILPFLISTLATATEQTVTVYADNGFAPFSYAENGKSVGYYPDIVRKIDELMPDYKIEIVPTAWQRALSEVEEGRVDFILPPYKNKVARPWMDYSDPIMDETLAIYCKKGAFKTEKPLFPQDFSGLNIIINSGFAMGDKFSKARADKKFNVIEEKTCDRGLVKFSQQGTDCIANNRLVFESAVKNLSKHIVLPEFSESAVISVEKGYLGFAAKHAKPWHRDFVTKFNAALPIALKTFKP